MENADRLQPAYVTLGVDSIQMLESSSSSRTRLVGLRVRVPRQWSALPCAAETNLLAEDRGILVKLGSITVVL